MLQVYCKKNIEELLSKSTLSLPQQNLINECKKAFEAKIRLVEFALDNNYFIHSDEVAQRDDYVILDICNNYSYSECVGIINEMKRDEKIDYNFLDLLLYSSIYIYKFTNKYDIVEFDELVLPPLNVILNEFWNDFTINNFPHSYSYFMNDLTTHIQLDGDVVTSISDSLTHNIGTLLKFRSKKVVLSEDTLVEYLQSYYHLIENHIQIPIPKEDLNIISQMDFTLLKEENLEEIIKFPKALFHPFIDNVKDNHLVVGNITNNIFKYIIHSANVIDSKRHNDHYIVVDNYCYSNGNLSIENIIKEMPFNQICKYYSDDLEYEIYVNNPLKKLLEVAYERDFHRKYQSVTRMLKSKNYLMQEDDFPF